MKKFLKSKIDENETTNQRALEVALPNIIGKLVKEETRPVPINPPLPLDPPPPDSPPKARPKLTVKEKKDILKNPDDNVDQFDPERLLKKIKTENDPDDQTKLNKPTVCRDFIRGTCTRPTTCKYAHEYDLSQLRGVYTFCHNFQNAVCKHPNCKFVHATISEEQKFYRTGILPPHTIAHHKNKKAPPPPQAVDTNSVAPVNTPAMLSSSIEKPVVAPMPPASMMSVVNSVTPNFAANSPGKPIWNDHDNCVGSPRGQEAEKLPKCDNCLLVENRLIHAKNTEKTLNNSIADVTEKLNLLEKKDRRLNAILQFLMKPKQANQQNDV